eukprot:NODE_23_length_38171_cov_0.318108.p7 type:complete len:558 gc:universal NODE_23_length_38171_cov_0.318108:31811-33484(+)
MANDSSRNVVKGPTSALTSFLRSRGINARNMNAYRTNIESEPLPVNTELPQSPEVEVVAEVEAVAEVEVEQTQVPAKRRNSSKKPAKKSKDDESSDFEIDVPRRLLKYSISCLKCLKTIPKYYERTSINLCNDCDTDLRKVATKSSAKSKNLRMWQIPDEFLVLKEESDDFPSLVTICVKMLIDNLDYIEDLGDLPESILHKISKLICRYRKLDSRVLLLFMNANVENIYLPDCNQLVENDFDSIFNICQFATSLNISFCGKLRTGLRDLVLKVPSLTSVKIHGAYLASDDDWSSLFLHSYHFEVLHVAHASKLSVNAIKSLASSSAKYRKLLDLRITQTNLFNSECVELLSGLDYLEILDISHAHGEISDDSLVYMLTHIGPQLKELYLNGFSSLSDEVILKGIPFCVSLTALSLSDACCVTVEAGYHLLDSLALKLKYLNLQKCDLLGVDAFLIEVIKRYGKELEYLNINGLRNITTDLFVAIAKCKNLKYLDASFCSDFNDLSFHTLKENCRELEYVTAFGCCDLTEQIAEKHYNANQKEIKILGTEYNHLMMH